MSVIGNSITLGGGGNPVADEDDVIFIDYDGTIRYSYSAEEFLSLTELPPNPTHDGLTAEGWNWTFEEATAFVAKWRQVTIGQCYITTDGSTKFFIYIPTDDFLDFPLLFKVAGSGAVITIDWGDGTTPDTFAPSSSSYTPTHRYAEHGHYVISIFVPSGLSFQAAPGDNTQVVPTWPYKTMVYHVRFGRRWDGDVNHVFNGVGLSSYTTPLNPDYSLYARYAFMGDDVLPCIILPRGHASYGQGTFYNQPAVKYIAAPGNGFNWFTMANTYNSFINLRRLSIKTDGSVTTGFLYAYRLQRLAIEGATSGNITYGGFTTIYSLLEFVFPYVTTVNNNSFTKAYSLKRLFFRQETPPSFSGSSIFTDLYAGCTVIVPYTSLAAYLIATNYPSPITYTYLGHATYDIGASLPAQDGSEAYNVTWYASIEDARSGTNAITTGNGKEVYCTYATV